MPHKIYPAASRRIIEIWHYTDKIWDVLGVVNVLHESMDIPNRLKEDLYE